MCLTRQSSVYLFTRSWVQTLTTTSSWKIRLRLCISGGLDTMLLRESWVQPTTFMRWREQITFMLRTINSLHTFEHLFNNIYWNSVLQYKWCFLCKARPHFVLIKISAKSGMMVSHLICLVFYMIYGWSIAVLFSSFIFTSDTI